MSISLSKTFAALAAAVALGGLGMSAKATILYSTGFDAPTYSNGGLAGQDGWAAHSGAGTNPETVVNAGTNGTVTLATSGEDDHRNWATAVTAGSIYLSADITVSSAQSGGDYFMSLGDGGSSNFNDRIFIKSSGTGFALAVDTGSGGTPVYGAALTFGTTYHIVTEYDIVTGTANDTASLYLNPTDSIFGGDNLYVAGTNTGADATSMLGVYLRQGSATLAAGVTVDNIAVAVPDSTPEPASLGILAVGGIAVLARRRKA